MSVSGPEVMYGAYYPYLYGRGAARSFHHAPHFQYDRFNVQSGGGGGGGAGGEGYGGAGVSTGSGSSGGHSPASPPHALHHAHPPARLRTKEEDLSAHGRASADGGASSESEGECGGGGGGGGGTGVPRARAQYVSANCVVFTHYSGDVAAVVDEHFARALSIDKPKECLPMVSRNLPASFFNAAAAAGVPAAGACAAVDLYDYDPWHQHYTGYGHAAHRHAAEYHAAAQAHHNMAAAAGYGGLLLGRSALPQYKPVEWPHAPHPAHHHPAQHHAAHLDAATYSYPPVPGLEAPVQDTSKDLYWF